MPTKPRPLGNKAKRATRTAIQHARIAANLLTDALRNQDRRPDTMAAQLRDARFYLSQIENLLLRLESGEFAGDD
jgi:hypothetical protein